MTDDMEVLYDQMEPESIVLALHDAGADVAALITLTTGDESVDNLNHAQHEQLEENAKLLLQAFLKKPSEVRERMIRQMRDLADLNNEMHRANPALQVELPDPS